MIRQVQVWGCHAGFTAAGPRWQRHPAAHFQHFPRRGQDSVFVRLQDDDGNVGYGEGWGLPCAQATAAFVEHVLGPQLLGRQGEQLLYEQEPVWSYLQSLGHAAGCGLDAWSAIDMALHDLLARRHGRSLAAFVTAGEQTQRRLQVYASPVPLLDDPQASVAAAMRLREQGFTALKVKVGRSGLLDLPHIEALRQELGPDVAIHLDANGAYSLEQAVQVAGYAATYDIAWLEDPLPVWAWDDWALLRQRQELPLAGGEQLQGYEAFQSLLHAGAVDVLVPNIGRVGGVTGMRRILDLACSHKVELSPHGVGGCYIQSATVQIMQAWLPQGRMEWNCLSNPLRDGLIERPYHLDADGYLLIDSGSIGLGPMLDEGSLLPYCVASARLSADVLV